MKQAQRIMFWLTIWPVCLMLGSEIGGRVSLSFYKKIVEIFSDNWTVNEYSAFLKAWGSADVAVRILFAVITVSFGTSFILIVKDIKNRSN